MYAQLGSIVFETLMGFTEYSKTSTAIYAEHGLLDGKPHLQRTGSQLDAISLSIRLHASFCNPAKQLAILKTSQADSEILPLLWGNGTVEGSFVITEIAETIEDSDSAGNVFSYVVNISLQEYVTSNKLTQEKEQDRKEAKAVGDKKPTARLKKNPSTCAQTIAKLVNGIENNAARVQMFFIEKGGIITPENKNSVKINLSSVNALCDNIISRADDPESCAAKYPAIKEKSLNVKNISQALSAAITAAASATLITAQNNSFQQNVKELKEASRILINKSITRNG